jgi:hypothetical protein
MIRNGADWQAWVGLSWSICDSHLDSDFFPAHIGHFVPLAKLADFLKAGVHVKVLLAGAPVCCQLAFVLGITCSTL